jgi:hypothetical protein
MESLKLSVPEQHDFTDPTVERNVERLRARLTNLPLMDVVETVRQVLNDLESMNEQKIDAGLRLQLLGVFRNTALRLFVTVDPLRLRQLTLAKTKREQATRGVEQLLTGMAGGYKIIVKEYYDTANKRLQDRQFGLAVNHALEQLAYVLLDCYRFYRSVQKGLFSELHQLYRIARHHGLLDVSEEHEGDSETPLTTATIYHTALLLTLTDPFRLAEGEVSLLNDVLKLHADKCRIIPGNSWSGNPEGLFFVDLRSDLPPKSCLRLEAPVDGVEPYLLDARNALVAIRGRLAQTPAKVRQQSPEAIVLRQLLPEQVDPRTTRAARYPDSRWAQVLLGLENIHAYQESLTRKSDAAQDPGPGGKSREPVPCRIIDTSEGGMRLAWDDGGAGDARVGDLLGVIEDGQRLQVAIIRNIKVYREGGMETGIQLLRGNTAPVYCRALENEEEPSGRALFMAASKEEGISATLLMAKGLYAPGRRLLIDVSGKEVRACAGRCIFDGPVFDRIEFAADSDAKKQG